MLAELESRLADALGVALPGPFAGRVEVAPGSSPGGQPLVVVAVTAARRRRTDFASGRRPELAPGADDPRRVVRLECDVVVTVEPANNAGRDQVVAGVDALLYALDGAAFRSEPTLASPADDPGFVLESLELGGATIDDEEESGRVELLAVGWFWPPEAPGVTGEPIAEARVRAVARPVDLDPWPVVVTAGGPAVPLRLTTAAVGTTVLDGAASADDPFGALALRLVDDGGRPGAGSLAGGTAGPDGARLVTLADGEATVEYSPPAEAGVDHLVVAVATADTGDGAGVGIELARFSLVVGA